MPVVPILLVAGAMQYSVKKFLFALTLGRLARYSILAFLGARYGRQVLNVITQNRHPALVVAIGLVAVSLATLIYAFISKRKKER
jgi:membrane protein DedA with SNARE-associated domain